MASTPPESVNQTTHLDSPEQAAATVEAFANVLKSTNLDGNTVFDTDVLPHPKDSIIAAIQLVLRGTKDDAARESLRTAGYSLAFYQSGTGSGEAKLGEKTPDGQVWRSIVEADMKKIALALA